MLYRYTGYRAGGERCQGEIEAPAWSAAVTGLKATGILVESVTPVLRLPAAAGLLRRDGRLPLRLLVVLFNQLRMLLRGGVPLLQGLQILAGNARGHLRAVLGRLAREVENGRTLGQAMAASRGAFPPAAVHVVAASEFAGRLESGLELLAGQLEREDQLQRKIRSVLVYPAAVLLMTAGLAAFMLTVILPRYAELFAGLGSELPAATRTLLAVAAGVRSHGLMLAAGAAGAGLGAHLAVRRVEGLRLALHRAVLHVAVAGPLIRAREAARYTRLLATMLGSGVPVLAAVAAAARGVQNAALANRLAAVEGAISRGLTPGQAIRQTGLLTPIMAELLTVGEMVGNTDGTLLQIAAFCEEDVNQTVQRLTALLEPVLVACLGGVVLAVVYPTLLPLFDIYTKMR